MTENDNVISLVSSIFNSNFLRTFKFVFKNQEILGNAIAKQDFDNILTPNKYFTVGSAVLGVGLLLEHTDNGWTWDKPFIYFFMALVFLPFLLTEYLCLRCIVGKQIGGTVEVLLKLYRCYAFVIGTVFGLAGILIVLGPVSCNIAESLIPVSTACSIFALPLVLLPILAFLAVAWAFFVAPPRIIATIYGMKVGQGWKTSLFGLAAGFLGCLCVGAIGNLLGLK
jgi:hypothetical protein